MKYLLVFALILATACSSSYVNESEDYFGCNYTREQFMREATTSMLRNGFEVVSHDSVRGKLEVMKPVRIDSREAELYFNFNYNEYERKVSVTSKSKIWNENLSTEEEFYDLKNYRPEVKSYMMILDSIKVNCVKVAFRN
ncbi:MAG: hypothetical protein CVV22_10535 [Ignavibacteriae bacterium HGW-Ignavibacteriae-1]|jgi:hypothetical protein|nr:MAG: hypothetical protein CVV22_10535 [Ignavibacteriae bacterium HGW-Ignavibacteriae-1]